ncbi:hypothetical protein GT37_07575 [Pseudomonas putida]|nr:hypothetical protein GT37_07575 [Pseudomonas putida]
MVCSRFCPGFDRQLIEVVLLTCEHVVIEESSTFEGQASFLHQLALRCIQVMLAWVDFSAWQRPFSALLAHEKDASCL